MALSGRVVVARRVPDAALAMLRDAGLEVDCWEGNQPIPRGELERRLPGAVALLAALTDRVDGPLLDRAPGLRVVANWAVGYDNIDIAAARERGIRVGNTPDVLTETSADLAFGLLLAVARRIVEGDRFVRQGRWSTWDPDLLLGQDVWGARLAIAGLGRIGEAVARRARGFGMSISYWSRTRRPDQEAALGLEWRDSPGELVEDADFLSLHTALTPETRHLVSAGLLATMQPTAILVNTGRGGLVDQVALVTALRTGRIAGAGLDVTDPEPAVPGDPLLDLPNVVLTPHIASATGATRTRMACLAAGNIIAALSGEPMPAPVV